MAATFTVMDRGSAGQISHIADRRDAALRLRIADCRRVADRSWHAVGHRIADPILIDVDRHGIAGLILHGAVRRGLAAGRTSHAEMVLTAAALQIATIASPIVD